MNKIKRSRGRPTKEIQVMHQIETDVIIGKELFLEAYQTACQLIISVMKDEKAPAATRLNAASKVKDSIEKSLEKYQEENLVLVDVNDPEEKDDKPKVPMAVFN